MREHDQLLRWISERQAGSLDLLKGAIEWLLNAGLTVVCRDLMALGHLEVDWERGRWCATPRALVLLPDVGLTAVLTGSRDSHLLTALDAMETSDDIDVVVERRPAKSGPEVIFIVAGSWDSMTVAADALGAAFQPRFSIDLCRNLPPIRQPTGSGLARPPADGQIFDCGLLRPKAIDEVPDDGLLIYQRFGRYEAYWSGGQGWFKVDLTTGRYIELRRVRRQVLHFAQGGRNGTLTVPVRVPLPPLQTRAVVLCSGTLPGRTAEVDRYVNVPIEVAEAIASSVGQELNVAQRSERSR